MPIKCTITLEDARDEYNEVYVSTINVSDPKMKVRQGTKAVMWKVINNTNARLEVRLRGFKNLTSPGNPHDPCTDVTPRREINVDAGKSDKIEVNLNGVAGDTHKYNVLIGKVIALDPELEIQP